MTKEERLVDNAERFFLGDSEFYCDTEVEDIQKINQDYVDAEEH